MNEHLIATTDWSRLDDLLLAAGSGDRAGFAELYDALSPTVYGLVSRLVGERDQAEDLSRDVFLEVWHTSAAFDPTRGSARAWVLALAHRRAVERARAMVVAIGRSTAHAGDDTTPTPLAALPPGERQSVTLAYFSACTHTEVARLTQTSLEACQVRMTSGLGRLRDAMVAPVAQVAPVAEPA